MSGEDIKEIRNIVTELKNDPANFHENPSIWRRLMPI